MIKKLALADWYGMKFYHKRIPIVFLAGLLIGILLTPAMVIPSCVILSFVFSVNTFAIEEKGELNYLYLTFPVKRSQIVAGRFTLSLLMGVCGFVGGVFLMAVINCFCITKYHSTAEGYMGIVVFSCLIFSICSIASFPVLFRFGYSKGKGWGLYLPLFGIGLMYSGIQILLQLDRGKKLIAYVFSVVKEHPILIGSAGIILAAGILFLSFSLSNYFYNKRDF